MLKSEHSVLYEATLLGELFDQMIFVEVFIVLGWASDWDIDYFTRMETMLVPPIITIISHKIIGYHFNQKVINQAKGR
jgi:hypothetical protein